MSRNTSPEIPKSTGKSKDSGLSNAIRKSQPAGNHDDDESEASVHTFLCPHCDFECDNKMAMAEHFYLHRDDDDSEEGETETGVETPKPVAPPKSSDKPSVSSPDMSLLNMVGAPAYNTETCDYYVIHLNHWEFFMDLGGLWHKMVGQYASRPLMGIDLVKNVLFDLVHIFKSSREEGNDGTIMTANYTVVFRLKRQITFLDNTRLLTQVSHDLARVCVQDIFEQLKLQYLARIKESGCKMGSHQPSIGRILLCGDIEKTIQALVNNNDGLPRWDSNTKKQVYCRKGTGVMFTHSVSVPPSDVEEKGSKREREEEGNSGDRQMRKKPKVDYSGMMGRK